MSFDPPTIIALACVFGIYTLTLLRRAIISFRVRTGDSLLEETLQLSFPAIHKAEFSCRQVKRLRIIVLPLNCGTECIGGSILLASTDGTTLTTVHEFKEPAALLDRLVTDRRAKHWIKGTGRSITPVIIELPEGFTMIGTYILTLDLHWNFLGTRLERVLPIMRVASIRFLVRSI